VEDRFECWEHTMPGFDDATITNLAPKEGSWARKLLQIWAIEREWPPMEVFTNGGREGIGYLLDRWRIGGKVSKVTKGE
jgi:hypothetical protein